MIRTLSGSNYFALRAELDRLVSDFVAEHGDMALEIVDCEEVEYTRITEAIQSLPFLSSKKLVVLKNPGTQKQFTENLKDLIETISDSTDVIIVEPKPDKRSTYYKQLKALSEFNSYDELDGSGLARWLVQYAKDLGGNLKLNDATYLINRVGSNQQLLSNELDKLVSYSPDINRQSIDLLTDASPQSNIFQLLDAAFAGNKKRLMDLYKEQRSQKVEPQQIIAMLTWQIHAIALAKTANDKSPATIAKEAGVSPFVMQKSAAVASKLSISELRDLAERLSQLDIKLKSSNIDADEALQQYLLEI